MKTNLSVAVAALCLALVGQADAQQFAPTVKVTADEWRLSTPRGAEVLLSRLGDAALEACGAFQGSLYEYRAAVAHSTCFRAKLDRAVAQLDAPLVSRLYSEEGPLMVRAR